MWSVHHSLRGDPGAFLRFFNNPATRLRNLLILTMGIGFFAFMPSRHSLGFNPRALILVIFPALVILLAWLYVKATARSFSLISREMPAICLENEIIEVKLQLHYNNPLPFAYAYLQDHFPAVDVLSSPEIQLQHEDFARTGSTVISYRHRLNRGYGTFNIGPVEIKISDPFNFFEEKRVFQLKTPLKVWLNPPAPDDLDLVKANALTPMGDSRATMAGHGMDFYGIKEYVHGDDIRAMSWLKTAQVGVPVIKQFERDTRPDVLVAVHTDRTQLRGFGFGNTMKRLLRIAAAIMGETSQRGLPAAMGLCIDDLAHHIRLTSSVPVYGFMTELLADLQPAEAGGLQQLLSLALSKAGPGTIVIFLSQTIHLDIDQLLNGLLTLQARGAKVSFWAIDDTDQARFSEETGLNVSKEDFKQRLREMNLDFVLLPSRNEIASPV
ncbi:MAG: hypothetical protein A2W80_13980 [Candidatus Riflebacteria bacterium GWC2_50_8]|nr:MAG: hypothetical protein A2W80_13980 [Candidatus Riflebacteria bacterium GWC2_50_8]